MGTHPRGGTGKGRRAGMRMQCSISFPSQETGVTYVTLRCSLSRELNAESVADATGTSIPTTPWWPMPAFRQNKSDYVFSGTFLIRWGAPSSVIALRLPMIGVILHVSQTHPHSVSNWRSVVFPLKRNWIFVCIPTYLFTKMILVNIKIIEVSCKWKV